MVVLDEQAASRARDETAQWLQIRAHLQAHRQDLVSAAAATYPVTASANPSASQTSSPQSTSSNTTGSQTTAVAGTALLSRPEWLPASPLPLDAVRLAWSATPSPVAVGGTGPEVAGILPTRPDGDRYRTYAEAMAELAAPSVFCNRSTYRLQALDVRAESTGLGWDMTFGPGTYFDGVNVGEACGHEFTACQLGVLDSMPLREGIGDPCDPARRPMNLAVATLVLRYDRTTGRAWFPLHWRDPAKVGHAGGQFMVMPVGIFQAVGDAPQHQANDLDLWRCLTREFAEEILGESEDHPQDVPVDYDAWPIAAELTRARDAGLFHPHVVGLGVDPLTLATDLLTVAVIDSGWWDQHVGPIAAENTEGRLAANHRATPGTDSPATSGLFEFTADTVEELTTQRPFQAAGAALLRLAWSHRGSLLA
jgi:hypothetical protein